MSRVELEDSFFRGRELAKRILQYYKQRDQENKERVRYSRHPTAFPSRDAIVAVLHDEALDENVVECMLNELSRTGTVELAEAAFQWLLDCPPSPSRPAPGQRLFDAMLSVSCSSFQPERALALLKQMEAVPGVTINTRSCNLAIASCSHSGRVDEAMELLERMQQRGLQPNSFTAAVLLQGCSYKGRGLYRQAIRAFQLMEDVSPAAVTDDVVEALLSVCSHAMRKAPSLGEAEAVFSALRELDLAENTAMYNALLKAAAKVGDWQAARRIFEQLEAAGVPADVHTFSHVIQASVAGGELDQALEVFEWMVAGRGTEWPIASDIATFNHLIRACHQAGQLEKALEITAWVQSTHVEFDQETYEELIGTVEIAQLWDDKALRAAIGPPSSSGSTGYGLESGGGSRGGSGGTMGNSRGSESLGQKSGSRGKCLAVFPSHLRPAPYDSLRLLYLEHAQEHEEEELLAQHKLGTRTSWVASTLLKGYPPSHFVRGGASPHIMAGEHRRNHSPVAISIQPSFRAFTIDRVLDKLEYTSMKGLALEDNTPQPPDSPRSQAASAYSPSFASPSNHHNHPAPGGTHHHLVSPSHLIKSPSALLPPSLSLPPLKERAMLAT